MVLKRMDNIGIVVEDLGVAIGFFQELGLELEGRATIEGEWAGRVTGLGDHPRSVGRRCAGRHAIPPAAVGRWSQSVSISPPSTRIEAPVVADAKGEAR